MGLSLEAWARTANARNHREEMARALDEREAILREEMRAEMRRSMRQSAEALEGRAAALEARIDEDAERSRVVANETLSRLTTLGGESQQLGEVVARLDRRSDRNSRTVTLMGDDIRDLGDRIRLNRPSVLRFKEIQQENEDSIFFIYSEITLKNSSGSAESTIGTYGTGFVVSEEGHIATSKHVAHPWKFREFARQIGLRGLEIDPDSYLIAAWPSGSAVLKEDDKLDFEIGFNNTQLRNLEVWACAGDRFRTEVVEDLSGEKIEIRYHEANDNQDLVILKAEGGPFRPLKTVRGRVPEKLDPVMVLGFPRGLDILEKGVAETSPSLGTVRKVQETIYVTASIIPGNSGGPVFDRQGNVIGIATRVVQGTETLGICLKADHVLDLVREGGRQRSGEHPSAMATQVTR